MTNPPANPMLELAIEKLLAARGLRLAAPATVQVLRLGPPENAPAHEYVGEIHKAMLHRIAFRLGGMRPPRYAFGFAPAGTWMALRWPGRRWRCLGLPAWWRSTVSPLALCGPGLARGELHCPF